MENEDIQNSLFLKDYLNSPDIKLNANVMNDNEVNIS